MNSCFLIVIELFITEIKIIYFKRCVGSLFENETYTCPIKVNNPTMVETTKRLQLQFYRSECRCFIAW